MRRGLLSALFSAVMMIFLGGCASEHMISIPAPPVASAPAPDKATVVFLRPSIIGGAIQSSVFDVTGETRLVGIVSAGRMLAHVTEPGSRRFMVIGENADFLEADLVAGRVYYARVEPRMGMWKARFALVPLAANASDLASDLASCTWVDNTPASWRWAQENKPSIEEKRAEFLVKHEAKPVDKRRCLTPDMGR